jgi:hypothetical protein
MINRVTGEVDFLSGLHILPHCSVDSVSANAENVVTIKPEKLFLKSWKRHVLGLHASEHGTSEVEALSAEDQRIHVVLLAHRHAFYEPDTPDDAERRTIHDGVISTDLAGQREFAWGQVICRLESATNKDWLVVAYSREAKVPLQVKEIILHLCGHVNAPEDNT